MDNIIEEENVSKTTRNRISPVLIIVLVIILVIVLGVCSFYFANKCDTCDGNGEIACSTCTGNGEVRGTEWTDICNACNGKKGIFRLEKCRNCDGTGVSFYICRSCGRVYDSNNGGYIYKCVGCGHSGTARTEKCYLCYKGQQEKLVEWCKSCDATGYKLIPCSTCKGEGKLVCDTCHGSGTKGLEKDLEHTFETLKEKIFGKTKK